MVISERKKKREREKIKWGQSRFLFSHVRSEDRVCGSLGFIFTCYAKEDFKLLLVPWNALRYNELSNTLASKVGPQPLFLRFLHEHKMGGAHCKHLPKHFSSSLKSSLFVDKLGCWWVMLYGVVLTSKVPHSLLALHHPFPSFACCLDVRVLEKKLDIFSLSALLAAWLLAVLAGCYDRKIIVNAKTCSFHPWYL